MAVRGGRERRIFENGTKLKSKKCIASFGDYFPAKFFPENSIENNGSAELVRARSIKYTRICFVVYEMKIALFKTTIGVKKHALLINQLNK